MKPHVICHMAASVESGLYLDHMICERARSATAKIIPRPGAEL
jgi:hypothetical protein